MATAATAPQDGLPETPESVVVRFAGDSGDGMQLLGQRFTHTAAIAGNDHATLPDFPAEIRAPAGTRGGVSGFQIQLASRDIFTPGDFCDVLVAMNPAALVKNLPDVRPGGLVIVNTDKFESGDLKKAELSANPLEDGSLADLRVWRVPLSDLTAGAVEPFGLNRKQSDRCKNFFALGMMYWLYSKPTDDTRAFLAFSDAAWAQWHAGPLLIEERESGTLLGSTGVACQTPYRVDTGYVLAEDAWGQGYASEALAAVLEALGGTTVWRVEAFCHPEHTASTSVLEKAGFELDGRLRRHTVFPNLAPEPQDVLVYSRILW